MTVYVEYIFMSNVVIDAFIAAFTVIVLRGKVSVMRLIFASVTGGIISCVYPLVGNYGYLLKLFCAVLLPVILIKIDKFRTYCTTVAVFLAISFALGGIVLAFSVMLEKGLSFHSLTYGEIPFILSSAGLIVLIIYAILRKNYKKISSYNKNIYNVTITNGNGFCNCKAFYDTGNRVYTNYGERVVLVSERVYNKLMPAEEGTVYISTPQGSGFIPVVDAEIVIYFPSGDNKIYYVKAGKGQINGDIPIILHGDMGEE